MSTLHRLSFGRRGVAVARYQVICLVLSLSIDSDPGSLISSTFVRSVMAYIFIHYPREYFLICYNDIVISITFQKLFYIFHENTGMYLA